MAVKYIPFFPEPIEGQALLNNFNRTLRYRGVEDLNGRLRRGMPFYEVETTEKVGDTDTDNMIIRGECLSACAYLKEQGIKVDLVYIDPPFASGADYAKKVYGRDRRRGGQRVGRRTLCGRSGQFRVLSHHLQAAHRPLQCHHADEMDVQLRRHLLRALFLP